MSDFDVIVIGGGSAGTAAAREATAAGARTALINDGELGGLCILRGCMPSKAMLASAHAIHEATQLEGFGARLEGRVVPDFARIMARKDQQVERFQQAKIRSIDSQDYDVISGRARFAPGGGVSVDGRTLPARGYVITTGSVPVKPQLPGVESVPLLTSDDVMRLTEQPASLLIVGAGAVGLEMAQFFARIGTEVVLVARSPLLERFDVDAGAELTRALNDEAGLELIAPGEIEELRGHGSGLQARVRDGDRRREVRAEALLLATGRRPALDGLGLEHLGLAVTENGLGHDATMRTARSDVFVAGDATGRYQLLHLANREGAVAGHNAAGGQPERTMDYRLKMSVVFTDPPYAHVGMTEAEARDAGIDIFIGAARFPETGRAITMNAGHGLWKMLIDRESCEILGASILGPRADDLIHLIALMMHQRATADVIPELPWYHPTLSEVMLNVYRDVAREIESCPLPVMPPA